MARSARRGTRALARGARLRGGAAALWLAQPTERSLQIGAIVGACGEALRVWAAGHLEKGREVTASGPYRLMRHPLYVGSTVMGIGLAIAAANAIVAILVLGYLAVTLTAGVRTEEAHLHGQIGPRVSGVSGRPRRGGAPVQRRARDAQSRISGADRLRAGPQPVGPESACVI